MWSWISRRTGIVLLAVTLLLAAWWRMSTAAALHPADKEVKVAQPQEQVGDAIRPRIVAAGTAAWPRPNILDNKTAVRVTLAKEVAAHLGDRSIVLLSLRYHPNSGGAPYFVPYWKKADNGFDIILVDTTVAYMNGGGPKEHLVDWAVIDK